MGSYMSYKSGIDEQNIKHLKAEIERLEVVLKDIASKQRSHHGKGWTLAQIAIDALEKASD